MADLAGIGTIRLTRFAARFLSVTVYGVTSFSSNNFFYFSVLMFFLKVFHDFFIKTGRNTMTDEEDTQDSSTGSPLLVCSVYTLFHPLIHTLCGTMRIIFCSDILNSTNLGERYALLETFINS